MNEPTPPETGSPPQLPSRAPIGDRGLPPRAKVVIAVAGCLAGVLCIAVFIGFLAFISRLSRLDTEFGRKVDGVVALTGGSDRITDALAVLEEQRAKRLLITGVGEKTAVVDLVKQAGHARLFECCVDIDREALNTVGNAIETARWVRLHKYHTLLVVTSNYHMPRAMVELRRYMPGVELVPHPVIAESIRADNWSSDLGLARLLFVEYLKYVVSDWRSRLIPVDPPTR